MTLGSILRNTLHAARKLLYSLGQTLQLAGEERMEKDCLNVQRGILARDNGFSAELPRIMLSKYRKTFFLA